MVRETFTLRRQPGLRLLCSSILPGASVRLPCGAFVRLLRSEILIQILRSAETVFRFLIIQITILYYSEFPRRPKHASAGPASALDQQ